MSGSTCERALAVVRATGQGALAPGLYVLLATTWTTQGRLRQAIELLDGAVEAARLRDDDQGLAWLLQNRSFTGRHTGDVNAALTDARESVEVAERIDAGVVTAWAGLTLGLALLAAGDAARAVEAMTAAAGTDLEGIPGASRTIGLEALTRARLVLGLLEDVARTARAARDLAAGAGLPYARAMADLARARVALAAGAPREAAELSAAAVREAEDAGALLDGALARTLAGRALSSSSGAPRRTSSASAPRATAMPPSRSCAGWASACGAVRASLPPAPGASTRSPSASSRSPAWPPTGSQPRDGRPAVLEREDDRDAHAQPVRQARGGFARAGGPRRGAGRPPAARER